MRPTRRIFLASTSAMALTTLLAACGSDSDGSAGSTDTDDTNDTGGSDSSDAAAPQLPVTITHKYGETTFTDVPKRVVVVGLQEQDTLIALGIVPVGVTYWFGDESAINPWATAALPEGAELPEVLDATNGVPIEKVAALQPDLIIAEYSNLSQSEYDLLSKLAPVLAQSGDYDDYTMPWDEMALKAGQAVGQGDVIETMVQDTKDLIAQYAEDNPAFAGQTAALVTAYEGLFVYGPNDPRTRLLGDLGFDIEGGAVTDGEGQFGISLSAERADELGDVAVSVWYDRTAEKDVAAVYEGTPAFTEGRWIDITAEDGAYYTAHSFVNTLALPYLLERYVPQLAAAVDGDPSTKVPAITD